MARLPQSADAWTRGPWHLDRALGGGFYVIAATGVVAECTGAGRSLCETEANARVMMHAPALVEKLQDCRDKFRKALIHDGTEEEYADIACAEFDALLDKVRGAR